MELITVGIDDFYTCFQQARTPYGARGFVELVAPKAQEVRGFVLRDSKGKPRLGLVAGRRADGRWHAPWSAPFAELMYTKPQSLETCIDFAKTLRSQLEHVRVTLPSPVYDPTMQPISFGALSAAGYNCYQDYNYHVNLTEDDFVPQLSPNARNHYNRASKAGFEFDDCAPLEAAYAVIAENRRRRGYPLAMSIEQLRDTETAGVKIHSMLLSLDGTAVASAIIYRITDIIAQLIYWGDVGGYENLRPMNLLAVRVYQAVRALGYNILDLGPSSSDGVPDLGLCTFKESVCGRLSFKPTLLI